MHIFWIILSDLRYSNNYCPHIFSNMIEMTRLFTIIGINDYLLISAHPYKNITCLLQTISKMSRPWEEGHALVNKGFTLLLIISLVFFFSHSFEAFYVTNINVENYCNIVYFFCQHLTSLCRLQRVIFTIAPIYVAETNRHTRKQEGTCISQVPPRYPRTELIPEILFNRIIPKNDRLYTQLQSVSKVVSDGVARFRNFVNKVILKATLDLGFRCD